MQFSAPEPDVRVQRINILLAIEFKIASIRFDEKDEFLNDTVSKRF